MNPFEKQASPSNFESYKYHIRNFVTSKKSGLKIKNLSIEAFTPFSNYIKSDCPPAPLLKPKNSLRNLSPFKLSKEFVKEFYDFSNSENLCLKNFISLSDNKNNLKKLELTKSSTKKNSIILKIKNSVKKSRNLKISTDENRSFNKGKFNSRSISFSFKKTSNSPSELTNQMKKNNFSISSSCEKPSKLTLKNNSVKKHLNFFFEDSDCSHNHEISKTITNFANDTIHDFYSKLRNGIQPLVKA